MPVVVSIQLVSMSWRATHRIIFRERGKAEGKRNTIFPLSRTELKISRVRHDSLLPNAYSYMILEPDRLTIVIITEDDIERAPRQPTAKLNRPCLGQPPCSILTTTTTLLTALRGVPEETMLMRHIKMHPSPRPGGAAREEHVFKDDCIGPRG